MKGLEKFLKEVDGPNKKSEETAKKVRPFLVNFVARIVNFKRLEGGLLVLTVAESYRDSFAKYKKDKTNIDEFIKNNNLWTRKIYVDKEHEDSINSIITDMEDKLGSSFFERELIHNCDITFYVKVGAYIGADGKAYPSLGLNEACDWENIAEDK